MIGRLVRLCRKSRKCMLLREGDRAGRLYRSSKRSSVGRVSRKGSGRRRLSPTHPTLFLSAKESTEQVVEWERQHASAASP
jgi:hypothetical protein